MANRHALTQAQAKAIKKKRQQGATYEALAKEYGVSVGTIRNVVLELTVLERRKK